MNIIVILAIILLLLYIYNLPKETLLMDTEDNGSYYIDQFGKHPIYNLPLQLNDIYELKYINTKKNTSKFFVTKGHYKHSYSKNKMVMSNGDSSTYQLIHVKNDIPFSGILL